jgi:DNA-binding transcriptional regulator LsrR (DeoR family)
MSDARPAARQRRIIPCSGARRTAARIRYLNYVDVSDPQDEALACAAAGRAGHFIRAAERAAHADAAHCLTALDLQALRKKPLTVAARATCATCAL